MSLEQDRTVWRQCQVSGKAKEKGRLKIITNPSSLPIKAL